MFSTVKESWLNQAQQDNPRLSSHFKAVTLIMAMKSLLPCDVKYLQILKD